MFFEDFETQYDIAVRHNCSIFSVRGYTAKKDFPKAERVIGRTKFYRKSAVNKYFAAKVDHRFRENKR
jgi:hypothetical protein